MYPRQSPTTHTEQLGDATHAQGVRPGDGEVVITW